MSTAIAVLTRKSTQHILDAGGSDAWVVNPDHAARQKYLVCCRNAHSAEVGADEPHGSAFLVGRISQLEVIGKTAAGQDRYRIAITEFARVQLDHVWKNWRNPVRYTTLEHLGINLDALEFMPVDHAAPADTPATAPVAQKTRKLTIAEAKEGLAATLGIAADQIRIFIRG